jgi:hypothetical protein
LDGFYKEVSGTDFNIRHVTKGAFSQARAKLKPEAFAELNDNVNATFYDLAPYLTWHNKRVLACDGSRLTLPKHKSIREEFGEHGFGPNADSLRSLALCSFLYDPLNLLTLDAQLGPLASSEKDMLHQHLEKVQSGDLLLLDRGYPSLALMFELTARGIDFCMRMKDDWWLQVKDFTESGDKQRQVTFTLPKKDEGWLANYPDLSPQITCRLVCVELENGEKEILCTSLTDTDRYPYEDFGGLYHLRWNVEEGYKHLKARIEVENFSGKTARAVRQDFFAKVFMMSLCAVLAFPIEEKVRQEVAQEKTKHRQKINRTAALSMTGNIAIGLFIKRTIAQAIQAFDNIVRKTLEIIRPNRKFERKKRPKRLYHMNYKRL